MAPKIGLTKATLRHGLAADEHVCHARIMTFGTDNHREIDGRAACGRSFCAGVDLGAIRRRNTRPTRVS
jgi:hypothetical protein